MSIINFSVPLEKRISCFIKLGQLVSTLNAEERAILTRRAQYENAWFTDNSINTALLSLSSMLTEESIVNFVLSYPEISQNRTPKNVAVVMAGNIPAVGFHDIMCVLLSGHILQAKLSKSDTVLTSFLLNKVLEIEPLFKPFIQITERLVDMEAVICTGSDNSARYFESYFGKYPHIIRKNRTSVALLNGNESETELNNFSHDIFTYFGLGCRNISKVFVPRDYDITKLIDTFEPWSFIINQHKYANNYTYNRAIMLMNQEQFLDNNFFLIKESPNLHSPISVLYFERYSDKTLVMKHLEEVSDKIQCLVSNDTDIKNRVPFGQTQNPTISDFADGVDTMTFLLSLS